MLAAFAVPAMAQRTIDGIRYNLNTPKNGEASVISNGNTWNGTAGNYSGAIVVPETITYGGTEYTVTCLQKDGYTGTFQYSKVTTVTLPKSINDIQQGAFSDCASLTHIYVDDDNTEYFDVNGVVYKYNHTNPETYTLVAVPGARTEITILPGTTEIADCAFDGCTNIKEVVIPETVTKIGVYAFANCKPESIICLSKPAVCMVVNQGWSGNATPFTDLTTSGLTVTVPAEYVSQYKDKNNTDAYDQTGAPSYTGGNPWANLNIVGQEAEIPTGLIYINDSENYTRTGDYVMNTETVDAENNPIIYTQGIYLRTFLNTNWQALYVPFDIAYDDWKDKFEVAEITGIFENGETSEIMFYVLGEVLESGSIVANKPYLIRSKTAEPQTITVKAGSTLYGVNSTVRPQQIVEKSTENATYTFTGQYTKNAYTNDGRTFAMAGGALKQPAQGKSVTLGAFRWYLRITPVDGQETATFSFGRFESEGTTGINEVTTENANVKGIYDLQGRKIDEITKPGLYIVDGVKKLVK